MFGKRRRLIIYEFVNICSMLKQRVSHWPTPVSLRSNNRCLEWILILFFFCSLRQEVFFLFVRKERKRISNLNLLNFVCRICERRGFLFVFIKFQIRLDNRRTAIIFRDEPDISDTRAVYLRRDHFSWRFFDEMNWFERIHRWHHCLNHLPIANGRNNVYSNGANVPTNDEWKLKKKMFNHFHFSIRLTDG